MKGFVIYPTYKVIGGKSFVCLYGRLENGESFLTVNSYKPYFYIKKQDLKLAKGITDFEVSDDDFQNFNGNKVIKIFLDIPAEVPKLKKQFSEVGIESYEADIRFSYRFMMDHDIQGSLEIEGEYEIGERVDRIYKEPDIIGIHNYKPKNIKILSFDIESSKGDPKNDELYCIGYVCGNVNKVFINSKDKIEGAISCNGETNVLENFINDIIELDPDVITGWNVIDFDLDYLKGKCDKLKVPFDFGRERSKVKLRIESDFFKDSKVDVIGRQVLDGLNLLKVSFIKPKDFKLDTVAGEILGDGKLIKTTGHDKYLEIDDLWRNNKKKLAAYNLKDADLVLRILEKSGVFELTILRSLLTGMPLDRVNASIASLDSLYIRETTKRKIVCPSAKFALKEEPIKGGYVKQSRPGIYDYILILDFKSLYPSMMRSFNIDPYSYVEYCKGKNLIKAPNGACFRNEDGIMPIILTELYHEREKARKEKDELTRYAIKILSNSFFGVLASPSCRFFDMNVANAITHFGQYIIQLTSKEIEKLGYEVIYQDTDSSFVVSKAKNLEEADKIGKKIQKHINEFYDHLIKEEYKRQSYLELRYEKCFIKCLMPKLRGREEGAKKRYAGLVIKNGKEEIEFTGLETVRSDWTELAKKYQEELLDRVFHNKDVVKFTKKFVDDVRKGKYDEMLVYTKSIRKDLKEYTKITPPHILSARKLLERGGIIESNKIKYVITEDGPEPVEKMKSKIDYEHYIKRQIQPIADSILVFFNTNFEDVLKGNKQLDLGSF